MIIALDGEPLVTQNISGIEQHARNIVTELSTLPAHHQYVLVLNGAWETRRGFDTRFVEALPPHFRQLWWSPPKTIREHIAQAMGAAPSSHPPADPQWGIFHSFSPGLPALHGVCLSHTVHDMAYDLDPDVRRSAGAARLRRQMRSAIRRAALTVAVSRQTAADVQALFQLPADRVLTIPNGINPVFMPLSDRELRQSLRERYNLPRRYLLMVGSDIQRRNYRLVIDGITPLFSGEPALRLVFAGRQKWADSNLFRRMAESGHLDRCVFIEAPSDNELAQLYRDATITVCGSSFEGFGLSVLEATACGCPVACSDMASLRELAEDAVVYFAHDDPASMTEAISSLLQDVDYRKLLISRGLKRATMFSWRSAALRLLTGLETAAGRAKSGRE